MKPFTVCSIFLLTLCCAQFSYAARYLLNKPKCTKKAMNSVERKVARLMGFGPGGRPFPENFNQLKPYCSESTKLIQDIENFFSNCYKKEMADLAKVMTYTIKSNIRSLCKRRSKKTAKLLTIANCINTQLLHDESCVHLFMNKTIPLFNLKQDNIKIPLTCCNYVEGLKCGDQLMDSIPCLRDQKEMINDFLRGLTGNMVDMMCGDYNEHTTKCDDLKRPVLPNRKPKRSYQTFMFVLIDLIESMESFQLSV